MARARHHREHVEGDYRNPPPKGSYDKLHAYSKSLMQRDPVKINHRAICEFVLAKLIDRLRELRIPVSIASFDGIHAHGLLQCRDHNPRIVLGIAKQYATAQLKKHWTAHLDARRAHRKAHGSAVGFEMFVGFELTLKLGEGLWGKGSHPTPIEDAHHYDSTFRYIRNHDRKGAVVLIPPPLSTRNPLESFDPKRAADRLNQP